jgi:predicted proteasome-type protease
MRSNVTVGPPIDLLAYRRDELRVTRHRRFHAQDPDLQEVHVRWEQTLRKAVQELPSVRFDGPGNGRPPPADGDDRLGVERELSEGPA